MRFFDLFRRRKLGPAAQSPTRIRRVARRQRNLCPTLLAGLSGFDRG